VILFLTPPSHLLASIITTTVKHSGNISLDDVYNVAKQMRARSYAKEFSGTVKEILGTCVSVGCTVDGQSPKEIIRQIKDGSIQCPDYDV
jgi:large subunit ribosomal protein L12e